MNLVAQQVNEYEWLKWIATEQGFAVALLLGFIVATYLGKVRYEREFKHIDAVNARLTEVVKENSHTTSEAVTALKDAVFATKEMVARIEAVERAVGNLEATIMADRKRR